MHTSFIHRRNPGKFSEMAQATTFCISSSAKMKDAGSGGTVVKSLLVKNTINKGKAMVFSGHVWM